MSITSSRKKCAGITTATGIDAGITVTGTAAGITAAGIIATGAITAIGEIA
jgi:hypothetical protein